MAELSNPILQQAEDKIETNLTPENQANYLKIVVAGQHIALDKGPNGLLAGLAKSQDPVADAAKGAISLCLILRKQAHGVMPLKAMVPAAMTLMLKALDFADRSKIIQIGTPELVRATHIFTDFLFARFGITKAGLANAANRVHAITQDPAQMELINRKAGIVKSPDASEPTAIPPSPAVPASAGSGLINSAGGS
jgi:hypothetical protein